MDVPELLPYTADKAALRRQLRARRNGVSARARRRAGHALTRQALRHRLLAAGQRVGFYMPANGEIDVLPLLLRAYVLGVRCFLPIVPGRGQHKLWFVQLTRQPHRPLHWRLNRYGIQEYHPPGGKRVRARQLQRLFVPLLGFDRAGYRIGMGGGYYDASLAYRRLRAVWRQPDLVGVAFSIQQVVKVPHDPWDIPLDGVLTEVGLSRPLLSSGNR